MRTIKHWALAAAAAAALALAGCGGGGGGGSSSAPTTPTEPPPKTALSYATDLNASVEALMALSGDVDAEGSTLMMAMKYAGMIGTESSDGNSMAAMMSAQKVLDAKQMLMDAIDAAEADKMEAEDAKAETDDADVIEALNQAISNAEMEIEAAQMVLDGDALAGYVDMVTGGEDADPMGTPASVAKEVAMAVAMALGPTSNTDGTGLRVAFETAIPSDSTAAVSTRRNVSDPTSDDYNPVAKANKFTGDNHMGKTWAMIVGEDNVMKMRLGTIDSSGALTAGNAEVSVASLEGMTAADVSTTDLTTVNTDGGTAAGDYMGIVGAVVCLGGTDGCSITDGKLGAGWYFSPSLPMAYYEKVGDATDYTVELYVNYGHWLVVDDGAGTATGNDGQVAVITYAALSGTDPGNGVWTAADPASTTPGLRASSATYSGMAAGRSVHKTLDGDGMVTDIQSGRFTADVMLTATFAGAGSTLGGMIDNFQGDAVDPLWEVTLNAATINDGANLTDGVTEATGQDGDWTADAYGATTDRPWASSAASTPTSPMGMPPGPTRPGSNRTVGLTQGTQRSCIPKPERGGVPAPPLLFPIAEHRTPQSCDRHGLRAVFPAAPPRTAGRRATP